MITQKQICTGVIETLEQQTEEIKSKLPKPLVTIMEPFVELTQSAAEIISRPLVKLALPYMEKFTFAPDIHSKVVEMSPGFDQLSTRSQ